MKNNLTNHPRRPNIFKYFYGTSDSIFVITGSIVVKRKIFVHGIEK
ncbi:MAG: hypothetical protein MJZ90_09810 [Bacteroidales bacterium]|nr:hypothetical protein [Bacteroidales bacterium]